MNEIQKKRQDILKAINQSFEKSGKTGFYTDTSENRKLGRVGQKYKKEPSIESPEKEIKGSIGTTKSGKPIMKVSDHKNHVDFTKEDHQDAADAQTKRMKEREEGREPYGKNSEGEPLYKDREWSSAYFDKMSHLRMIDTINNSENTTAINKVKKHFEDNHEDLVGEYKIMASSNGYYINAGGNTYYEYDELGKFKDTVPASFYFSSNSFLSEHKHVGTVSSDSKKKESKEESYNNSSIEERKAILGSKFKNQANRRWDALSDSARHYLQTGKKFKDPWKREKFSYQSYGDRKDF